MSDNSENKGQHTLLINYYEQADDQETGLLEKLIGLAIDYYVDESVFIENEELIFRNTSKRMIKDLNQIVKDGIKYYDYKEISEFKGFSERAEIKIQELHDLDLSVYKLYEISDDDLRDQMRYYHIQKELNDLKLLLNTEIGNFANDNLMILADTKASQITSTKKAELLKEIEDFEKYDALEPVVIELSESTVAILQSKDESTIEPFGGNESFQDEILKIIQQNSDKIESLSAKIEDLEQNRTVASMDPNDMDEIKQLIQDMVSEGLVSNTDGNLSGPQNLPDEISLYFEKGSGSVSLGNKLILSEVMDILLRNPRIGIIVTGFADKTGDEYSNFNLSKKRAANVRKLALESGVESHRILMNYFGSELSRGSNPGDRRVLIEFVPF